MRIRLSTMLIPLLLSAAWASAQKPATQPKPMPVLPAGVRAELDIPYVPNGDPSQALDLYLPETPSDKPLPIVVYVHGGGWRAGSKAGCPPAAYVPQGYAAASVEYRFSQKAVFPAQIQDCQAAIRFLRANAKKYNIDPERVGVWGESAGGTLVALLGTTGGKKAFPPIGGNEEQSDRVQAVCNVYGPTDFTTVMKQAAEDKTVKNIYPFNTPADPYWSLIGAKLGEDERSNAVSAMHYVGKDNAPTLILHGTADVHVPFAQSVAFAEASAKAGVDVTLQKFPNGGHGGEVFGRPAVRQLVRTFFDKHLKGADVKVEVLPPEAVTTPAGK